MTGQKRRTCTISLAAALLAAMAFLGLSGCQDNLAIKDAVQKKVDDSQSMLRITAEDGSAILPGDTVRWPATISTVSAVKTFTLTNRGDSNVALTGTAPVAVNGGTGKAAFEGWLTQPALLTLPPSGSTSFTAAFLPPAPDADYVCDLVVNSDDPKNPAYAIHASGRSTQWHGSTTVATSTSGRIISPQLSIDGSTAYLTYSRTSDDESAISIRTSTNAGLGWLSDFGGGRMAVGPYPHLLAVTSASLNNGGPHIFYYDGTAVRYMKYLNGGWRDGLMSATVPSGAVDMVYGDLCLSGMTFVTWYDAAADSLYYNCSMDPRLVGPQYTTSFITPVRLTGGTTGRTGGRYSSIKRDSGENLYIAYIDGTPAVKLIYAASTNMHFDTAPTVSTGPEVPSCTGIALALTESSGVATAHVVYARDYNSSRLWYTSTSSANLDAWTTPVDIGVNNRYGRNLCLKADGTGKLYVLHQNSTGVKGVVLSYSTDSGATWGHRLLDGDASLGSGSFFSAMALALDGDAVYAAYTTDGQTTNRHPNGHSVTLMKSIDRGMTW